MRGIKRRLCALLLSVAALAVLPGVRAVAALPESIVMEAGGAVSVPGSALLRARVSEGATLNGQRLTAEGASTLTYDLLGLLPVKTVSVSAQPERRLIPGGQSVGIAIDTRGVVVVGNSDLGATPSPARLAGLRSGDIIQRINGKPVLSAKALSAALDGETVTLDVLRDGRTMTREVAPALDGRDGAWRLGAWVRDSTAGVGTLTFIDPETGLYGALGHAITDADTSVTLPVGVGELYDNRVVDVTPSKKGNPGEVTGDFVFDPQVIGTVERNAPQGIFGHAEGDGDSLYPEGLPAAHRSELRAGAASLITTVDGAGPAEYACEIVRLTGEAGPRSMVIRITDPELLKRTGGIVQGMSGSPILQDGRLVGAVTHVMINDPAMGYGIDIDAMLRAAEDIDPRDAAAASCYIWPVF